MSKPFVLHEDPLRRFGDVFRAVLEHKRWSDDTSALRYSALALVTAGGEPADVAERLFAVADELKAGARWYGALQSSIRFAVAAVLLRSERPAVDFAAEVDRVTKLFRARGMRRGSTYEMLAVLVLQQGDPDRPIDDALVARVHELYEMMKRHHWWLTGPEDYPACALLARREEPLAVLEERIEGAYRALRDQGYSSGDPLQMASHILSFNPLPTRDAVERFHALYRAFDEPGLWMGQGDYDEMAILAFLEQRAADVVATVLRHREAIEALPRKPSKKVSFSLACNTAFLELVRLSVDLRTITDANLLAAVQAILSAQAAASAAAASAAAASAAG